MTSFTSVLHDIEQLPPEAQKQIFDFIEFIKSKQVKSPPSINVDVDTDYLFGFVHVTKQLSLDDIDEVIAQQGEKL